ncbi:MAG: transposase [Pseudomonadota bacterium]
MCVYSTSLEACDSFRVSLDKTFENSVARDKNSMGLFMNCKFHLIIDYLGQVVVSKVIQINGEHCKPAPQLAQALPDKLYDDLSKVLEANNLNKAFYS